MTTYSSLDLHLILANKDLSDILPDKQQIELTKEEVEIIYTALDWAYEEESDLIKAKLLGWKEEENGTD